MCMSQDGRTTVQLTEEQKRMLDETQDLIEELHGHPPTKGATVHIACETYQEVYSE